MRDGIFGWLVDSVRDARVCDRVAHAVQPAVKHVFETLPNGRNVKNVLHGAWLGHALHPVLTDVPIGAWMMAAVFDATGAPAADMCVAIGIAAAIPTAVTGLNDWSETSGAPARVGVAHAACNIAATALYAASYVVRRSNRRKGVALAYAGFGLLMLGGVLGGHLVFAQRAGVNHAVEDGLPVDEFVAVMPEADLPYDTPYRAQADGKNVLLVRQGDRIFALLDMCSHLGGPLSGGSLADCSIRCPWHGSRFSLEDGRVIDGPATIAQPTFAVRVREGRIELRLDKRQG